MKAWNLVAIVLLLASAGQCSGQVKAVVTGPKQANIGDLVVLDASQSQGQKYKWLAVGHTKSFLPVDAGIRLVFASGQPGVYQFALIVAGTNPNGGAEAEIADWSVTVGTPQPPPPPVPPVPPDPTPAKQPWVCIVTDPNSPTSEPGAVSILTGTALGAEFERRGWKAPDGLLSFMRVDRTPKFGDINPERRKWLEAAVAAANASGKPFPLFVWTDGQSGVQNVEPFQKDEAAQLGRLLQIAGVK